MNIVEVTNDGSKADIAPENGSYALWKRVLEQAETLQW